MAREEFDESKDALIAHVGIVPAEGEKGLAITVDVKAYNGGAPKIRLNRTGAKKDGEAYTSKLGSIDAREARALADLLPKAADTLDAAAKKAAKGKKS